jgi:hypothetical protein
MQRKSDRTLFFPPNNRTCWLSWHIECAQITDGSRLYTGGVQVVWRILHALSDRNTLLHCKLAPAECDKQRTQYQDCIKGALSPCVSFYVTQHTDNFLVTLHIGYFWAVAWCYRSVWRWCAGA